jgi:hypothetical protein
MFVYCFNGGCVWSESGDRLGSVVVTNGLNEVLLSEETFHILK